MKKEPAIKWTPLIIGLIPIFAIFLCVILFMLANYYYDHQKAQRIADLQKIAQQLGSTPQTELGQGAGCGNDEPWLLSATCFVSLAFTTTQSFAEFEHTADSLHLNRHSYSLVDPMGIFIDVNLVTRKTLTLDGEDFNSDWRKAQAKAQQIDADEWSLRDDQKRLTLVLFYDTSQLTARLEVDGTVVHGNVVYVRVDRGLIPIFFW